MNKALLLTAFLVLAFPIGVTAAGQDTLQVQKEFRPSGKPIVLIYANVHNTFSDGDNLTAFEVTRGFLGYDYSFSKRFSAKVLYDATSQTENGSVILESYLRNAYLQYTNGIITVRGGIIPAEQLTVWESLWNYRYITRPFIEGYGMTLSSDLGMTFKYRPSEILSLDFSITNGHGAKDIEADTSLRYDAGITLHPVKNFTIRGYFDIMTKSEVSQWTTSISGAYSGTAFSLGAEYYMQKNHLNISQQDYAGINIFTSVKIRDKMSLFADYNYLFSNVPDGETEKWNAARDGSNIIAGIDFAPVKGVRLAPVFTYFIPEESGMKDRVTIGFNIEARF